MGLDEAEDPRVKRRLTRIHENARSAGLLANMLLSDATTIHRIETQVRELVDLCGTTEDALQMLRAESAYGSLMRSVTLDMVDRPLMVKAEPIALREMVRNIIENAFIHAPGEVCIRLHAREGVVVLQVMDRGPGIPDSAKNLVFQRFARTDIQRPGTGLGLAIAKDVAVAFDGSIGIIDRDGGGAVIEVKLPMAARDEKT